MEIWKDIKGYEKMYQISNLGNVKSLKRKYCRNDKILKQAINKKGYKICALNKNRKIKSYIVHRLIALSFIKNEFNKPQINHKNGIKTDNRIENLEWCTNSENQLHAYKIGLSNRKGENHTQNKLKNSDIYKIRNLYNNNYSLIQLAQSFNTTSSNIYRIVNLKTWKHLL